MISLLIPRRCLVAALGLSMAVWAQARPVDFATEIVPILQDKCFLCHSTEVKNPKAGLRLDTRARIESFKSDELLLVAGKPEQSSLYRRVALPHEHEDIMPPEGKKAPLDKPQIELVRQWIQQGAAFGDWTQAKSLAEAGRLSEADVPKTTRGAVNAVEALLEAGRRKAGVRSTGPISDEVFLRRVYLDIAGRIPSLAEAREFLDSKDSDKRATLIDRLLASEGHVSHFYNYWANVFRIRESRWGPVAIRAFQEWVKRSIRENRPWDQMTAEIMNATGNGLENPAVGYWYRDYQMPLDNLAYTTQTFLATQLDCAVCHNHPFDKWSQYEFFELAAFLNEPAYKGYMPGWVTGDRLVKGVPLLKQQIVEVDGKSVLQWMETPPKDKGPAQQRRAGYAEKLKTMTVTEIARQEGEARLGYGFSEYVQNWGRARVAQEAERGASGFYATPTEGERNYSAARLVEAFNNILLFRLERNGRETAQLPDNYKYDDAKPGARVKPSVPFGKLPERKPGQPIHSVMAAWMTSPDNQKFTKTIANRLFAYVFGIGLYQAHDSIRDDDESSHPELTALLEGLMRRSKYDMREFMRVLYNTPTYQSAAVLPQSTSDPKAASPTWPWNFEGAIVRRNSAEQFWDSIVTLALPQPDQRKAYFRYQDVNRWKDLANLPPENLFHRGMEIIEEEHRLRLAEATDKDAVRYTFKEPNLVPSAAYRGYSEDLARASELTQPVTADHFLRTFGASDREMIENSNRSTTVPQTLALMNRLVDSYVLSPGNKKRGHAGSPVSQVLEAPGSPAQKVEALYLSILSRVPSVEETQFTSSISSPEDLNDLVWALINSEEFRIWH